MLSFMHVKMPLGTQDPHPPAQVWEPSVSVLYTANRTVPVSLTPGFPQKKLSLEAIVQGQRTQQSLGRNFPITGYDRILTIVPWAAVGPGHLFHIQ